MPVIVLGFCPFRVLSRMFGKTLLKTSHALQREQNNAIEIPQDFLINLLQYSLINNLQIEVGILPLN